MSDILPYNSSDLLPCEEYPELQNYQIKAIGAIEFVRHSGLYNMMMQPHEVNKAVLAILAHTGGYEDYVKFCSDKDIYKLLYKHLSEQKNYFEASPYGYEYMKALERSLHPDDKVIYNQWKTKYETVSTDEFLSTNGSWYSFFVEWCIKQCEKRGVHIVRLDNSLKSKGDSYFIGTQVIALEHY